MKWYTPLMISRFILITTGTLLILNCCKNGYEGISGKDESSGKSLASDLMPVNIASPLSSSKYTIGDVVPLKITSRADTLLFDSARIYLNGNYYTTLAGDELTGEIATDSLGTGRTRIKTEVFSTDYKSRVLSTSVILLSDIEPTSWDFEVIDKFNHDKNAYTQGLVYEDGFLYESTGQYGRSTLRKVVPNTGEVVKSLNLKSDLFGEGIALYNDKIVQITWKSQVGFVYDKKTFELINKIYYQNREGWGITWDGKQFFMSDGSNTLYILDKEYFSVKGTLEVYDNNGPVNYLNELEMINGRLYSNIWGKEHIVVIDPEKGKVLARIDLKSIVPEGYSGDPDLVMNGIAYNPDSRTLYVTGKNWPILYEIRVLE
ncbi:MAG: glutaminyl-peptide cyclotransferase [Bacteroidales bacterium]